MKIEDRRPSRIAIYVYNDKEGWVDDYANFFVSELKKSVDYMLVVVNGAINYAGFQAFSKVADEVQIRPNEGYDISGYKYGIDHVGWDRLEKFDECVFANSSLFGPIYPFEEMFAAMDKKDVDFWGITKFNECEYTFKGCKYNYTPEHIQSSFLVVRSSMCKTAKYHDVWDNLPEIRTYEDAIALFELPFTKERIEEGFVPGVYIDTADIEGFTRYPLMMMADELIINRRCPVMKQKSFSQWYYDILSESIGKATSRALRYIEKETNYDVNLIWDNILRKNNISDIKNHLDLNVILPSEQEIYSSENMLKVALVMHLYYEDQVDTMLSYASSMPRDAKLFVITPNDKILKSIQPKLESMKYSYEIIGMPNRGRDVSALLVAAYPYIKNYELICFVHDKKSNYIKPFINGLDFFYQCMENTLGSREYVANIIGTFAVRPRLGMLMPPNPIHGDYYQVASSEWAGDYDITIELANKLGMHVDIDSQKPPISPLGTMFWFRPAALNTLLTYDWDYSEFPEEPNANDGTLLHAIERIYGFVCQNDGYYPAWAMTTDFAAKYLNNLYFMVRELNLKLFPYFWPRHFFDLINRFDACVAHVNRRPTKRLKESLRNSLEQNLPTKTFELIIRVKRFIFGPHI